MVLMYIIYNYIKNFVWEDRSLKQCFISHIALLDVNCAISNSCKAGIELEVTICIILAACYYRDGT